MTKSQRDLKAAQILLFNETYVLDSAVYHCQQAAEKALKGYLAHQKLELVKTQDLTKLLQLCIPFAPSFECLKAAAKTLTPYAFEFRYPGDYIEPDETEAEKAVKIAAQIVDFVVEQIPDEITNSTD